MSGWREWENQKAPQLPDEPPIFIHTSDGAEEYVQMSRPAQDNDERWGAATALAVANDYGDIDGAHHKQWVIDQMVRALCVSPSRYLRFRREFEEASGYEWDEGTPP